MGDDGKKNKKVERVMVHCRVRPINDEDLKSYGRDVIVDNIDENKGVIALKRDFDRKTFTFDAVFDQNSTQKLIYSKVGEPVVSSILQGYNGTIFAYGQTGTGKTFTMIGGTGEAKGVIPRSISQIFSHIQSSETHSFQVKVGFLQLYMEMLQDLLRPDENKTIRIREDPDEGVYLTGVNWVNVNNVKACMDLLAIGDRNRSTAFTSMNATSSRSHAVYMVKIERRVKYNAEQLEELEKKGEMPDQSMTKSTLYLVDLAGSERVSKSRASGNRLDEARNINLALLALGNCIQALSDKKAKYVPFRDSKLTRILEDSLGGNSKTSLIVTIGPSVGHIQESLSALQFGMRAMKIENRPQLNIKVDYRALCAQLQAELDKINDGSNMYNIAQDQYLNEINNLKGQIEKLLAEREQMENLLEEYRKGHNDLTQFEERKKAEIEKIQKGFQVKLEKKEVEHKKFLDEIDKLMLEQEKDVKLQHHQIVELKNEKKQLNNEVKHLQEELEQEKADRELRASQLVTEISELKQKMQAEKVRFVELQQEIEGIHEISQEKNNVIQELRDSAQVANLKFAQETENLKKEMQKYQSSNGKMKQTLLQKAKEWKESSEKIEKAWQETAIAKEKEFSDKKEELERKINSLNLAVTQLDRENLAFKEDLALEKSNFVLQTQKNEKSKENYEKKISDFEKEISELEQNLSESGLNLSKLLENSNLEKKKYEESLNSLSEELKRSKKKNGQLLKAYKENESKSEAIKKDLEQKLLVKTDELSSFAENSQKIQLELQGQLEKASREIADVNKDRSKLIQKLESKSKKASNIEKQKNKLYTEVEAKQIEYQSLVESRDYLENELENMKKQVEELVQLGKTKDNANDDLKSSILKLSNECHKKETSIKTTEKMIKELQESLLEQQNKISEYEENISQSAKELGKVKSENSKFLGDLKSLEIEKAGLAKDLRTYQTDLEKSAKELKKLGEELEKSQTESKENTQNYSMQKDQLASKLFKLSESYKILESEHSVTKNDYRAKKLELNKTKEIFSKTSKILSNNIKIFQENVITQTDEKIAFLSKTQNRLVSFIKKLKESVKLKKSAMEKMKSSSKREVLLLNESFAKEISALKLSQQEMLENLEEKYSQEVQEQQLYFEDIIKRSNLKNEKSQQDLKEFYLSQLDNQSTLEKSQFEEIKSSHNRQVNEIKQSYSQQISELKEDYASQIAMLEGELKRIKAKSHEEINALSKDFEGRLEEYKQTDEETFQAMLKSKQKEIEQLTNENTHLRNEFESTIDRQKNHSSVMKNHQLGLIEEIYKGHKQEVEAMNIENENKIKRKDNEIADLKKKFKEISEASLSKSREIEDLEILIETAKAENKKFESEIKKVEQQKQVLDGEVKLIGKKFEYERNKNIDSVCCI